MRSLQALGLFFVLATVVATVSSYRLTAGEDYSRGQQCGKVTQNKIYGTELSGKEVPWLVQVNHTRTGTQHLNSGFFISDRHVLTSSDTFLDYNQGNFTNTFRWLTDSSYADLKTCRDRIMPVPSFALKGVFVHTCVDAKLREDCQKSAAPPVVSAYYIGNCNPASISFGLAVMELAAPVKTITPLCVSKTRLEKVGEMLRAYGAGYGKNWNLRRSGPASHYAKVIASCIDEQNASELGLSVCLDYPGSCQGDYGGPVTKVVNSQQYAVASLWSYGCEWREERKKHVSVSSFIPEICKLTGVCQSPLDPTTTATTATTRKPTTTTTTTRKPTTTTTAAKSKSRLVISKHFVLTKIAE